MDNFSRGSLTMLKQTLFLTALALVAAAPAAYADSVTDTGSVYSLSYTTSGPDSYEFTLTIDASGYAPPAGDNTNVLNAVAIDVLKSSGSYESESVVSAPSGYASSLTAGGLGAGGCNNNSSNYLCLAFSPTPGGEPTGSSGDVYTFVFDINTSPGGFKTTDNGVKAVYDTLGKPANGSNTDVYTESITPTLTPEPSSLALLGTSILGAAGLLRRRLKM
jgi:hypothetical protein